MSRILTKMCMLILGVMVMIPSIVFADVTAIRTQLSTLADNIAGVAQPVGPAIAGVGDPGAYLK